MKEYPSESISPQLVNEAALSYGITKQQMAAMLGISDKTFYNMMKAPALDSNQSDRFTFISNILREGEITFITNDNFKDWLHTEQPTLDGFAPIVLLGSLTGAQEVLAAIIRIRQGIFA